MTYRKSLNSTVEMASWYNVKYREMNGCWQTPEEELDRHLDDFGMTRNDFRVDVLDIGCGDGSLVKRIIQRGSVAVGIEISQEACERAERGLSVVNHDICSGPFGTGTYTHIISLGSLEHVIDIDAALENIRLSLTPEGRWYFYIPNELWKHNDQPNERAATDAEWTALFEKHGLIVESAKRWNDSTAFQGRVYKSLRIEVSSVICSGPGFSWPVNSANEVRYRPVNNRDNRMTPCDAYQKALNACESDILVMVHDDVTIHDADWLERIEYMFSGGFSENKVAVGFGGATSLGRPNLYRRPYDIWNMARGGYASNQTDAEVHGDRFTGVRRVAVLDAFLLALRVEWLRRRGGWPVSTIHHHGLDLWLACEAARDDKETWLIGSSCTHHGGGTSTSVKYRQAEWLSGGTLEEDHREPHRILFETYRDVLPIRVSQ